MTDSFIQSVFTEAFWLVLSIIAPLLGISLLVGLLISIFQATTSIQEQTLSFVPKMVAMILVALICGPWMGHRMLDFTSKIFSHLQEFTFIKVMFSLFLAGR